MAGRSRSLVNMKIIAALTAPDSVPTYLEGVGLPARAPPIAAARPNPQPEEGHL